VTVVLDTDVLIDHLRQHDPATRTFVAAVGSGRRVAASVLTRVEVRRGSRPHQAAAIDDLDVFVDWVPVDHEIAAIAAAHAERFGKTHGADAIDYVIGATAERLDADLLTRNVRHFPMFPDLRPPY
jgi:hypothetical protein